MTALPNPPTGHPRPTRGATLAAPAPRGLTTGFLLGLAAASITLFTLFWLTPIL